MATQLSALSSQLPTSAEPHTRLIVAAIAPVLRWQMRAGERELGQGETATFAEIRGVQVRAGIWDVIIDGPDTPELRAAAGLYGWQLGASLAPMRASA